jgi:hypothetical protein
MKHKAKKLMISTIIGLTLSCTATAALADDSTTTTVPSTTKTTTAPKITAAQRAERAEYLTKLKTYKDARLEIVKNFNSSINEAIDARRVAQEAAKTQQERKAVREAFATAITTAKTTKEAALTALGEPPVKPTK